MCIKFNPPQRKELEMDEREKLVKELETTLPCDWERRIHVETVADFILEDRKRICEPLVKYNNKVKPYPYWIDAIDQTLKNAGLEQEK